MDPNKNRNFHEQNEKKQGVYEDEGTVEREEDDELPSEGIMRHIMIAETFLQTFGTTSLSAMEDILRSVLKFWFLYLCTYKNAKCQRK